MLPRHKDGAGKRRSVGVQGAAPGSRPRVRTFRAMTDGKLSCRLGLRIIKSSYSATTLAEPRSTARTVSCQLHRLNGT